MWTLNDSSINANASCTHRNHPFLSDSYRNISQLETSSNPQIDVPTRPENPLAALKTMKITQQWPSVDSYRREISRTELSTGQTHSNRARDWRRWSGGDPNLEVCLGSSIWMNRCCRCYFFVAAICYSRQPSEGFVILFSANNAFVLCCSSLGCRLPEYFFIFKSAFHLRELYNTYHYHYQSKGTDQAYRTTIANRGGRTVVGSDLPLEVL